MAIWDVRKSSKILPSQNCAKNMGPKDGYVTLADMAEISWLANQNMSKIPVCVVFVVVSP